MVECHAVKLKGYEGLQQAWCLSHANLYSFVNSARRAKTLTGRM